MVSKKYKRGKILRSGSILTGVDIGDIKLRISQIQIDYPYFLEKTLGELLEKHILKKIHVKMEQDGISQKVIQSTKIDAKPIRSSKQTVKWSIVSNYTSVSGFPVAVMIEHGRRAFFVEPKEPTDDRPNPTLKFEINKAVFFSKGHWIPAYPAKKFVFNTIRDNKKLVQRELNAKTKEFIRIMMGDHVVRP